MFILQECLIHILVIGTILTKCMKTKYLLIVVICLIIVSCSSYLPFFSKKDKRESVKRIKNEINLSKDEFGVIKNKDSILYEVSLSIEKEIDSKLIKRRLDSFLLNNYSKKELLHMLKTDRVSYGWSGELVRNADTTKFLKIKNIEEYEAFMRKLDSNFSGKSRVKVKIDTLKTKK